MVYIGSVKYIPCAAVDNRKSCNLGMTYLSCHGDLPLVTEQLHPKASMCFVSMLGQLHELLVVQKICNPPSKLLAPEADLWVALEHISTISSCPTDAAEVRWPQRYLTELDPTNSFAADVRL